MRCACVGCFQAAGLVCSQGRFCSPGNLLLTIVVSREKHRDHRFIASQPLLSPLQRLDQPDKNSTTNLSPEKHGDIRAGDLRLQHFFHFSAGLGYSMIFSFFCAAGCAGYTEDSVPAALLWTQLPPRCQKSQSSRRRHFGTLSHTMQSDYDTL